jgi:hypothetical protein
MRPIDRSEVLPIGEYELVRPHFRARVIAEKRERRVAVGDNMTATFENRDSVLLQIQEMLRTERITSEPAILHEIETYNDLIPAAGQLSVTLFVEEADREARERLLEALAGLERSVYLDVDGASFLAYQKKVFAAREDRTTAVHYFKVDLSREAVAALRAGTAKAAIVVRHPRCEVTAPLAPPTLRRLADDLA